MTYKTLLVHVDDSQQNKARVDFALQMARAYDAHLVAVYVTCQDIFRPLLHRDGPLNLGAIEARGAQRMNEAHDQFVAAAERSGCRFEWRAPSGDVLEAAVLHARHADLVIVSQEDPEDDASYIARDFIEDLVMEAGRPVLVLPHGSRASSCGNNVVIGWDGSREAARAIGDALPILKRARFVTVCTIDKHPDRDEPAGIDVSAYLEHQGVRAAFAAERRNPGMSTGATLLDKADALHADLVVAGAYAHARGLERVLGGVTRTLLEAMTAPVLVSH